MVADRLTKPLILVKHKYFITILRLAKRVKYWNGKNQINFTGSISSNLNKNIEIQAYSNIIISNHKQFVYKSILHICETKAISTSFLIFYYYLEVNS